jgi:hypothetical protein
MRTGYPEQKGYRMIESQATDHRRFTVNEEQALLASLRNGE